MSYLLDTCVLSEFAKPTPSDRVTAWLNRQREAELFLSAIVLGEIAKGVSQLPDSRRKRRLAAWLHTDVRHRFRGRILPVDEAITLEWGETAGALARDGQAIGMADGLIGATARHHALVVVTRNTRDIARTGAALLNPWED